VLPVAPDVVLPVALLDPFELPAVEEEEPFFVTSALPLP